jgi:uncharacterized protein YbjT (DUF2867 family)
MITGRLLSRETGMITEVTSHAIEHVLLTGATGYVGGRLLRDLEKRGYRVRCLTRRPEYLKSRISDNAEAVQGDALDAESLKSAFEDIDVAYYLVHSMGSKEAFEEQDRQAAANFATAARHAHIRRIIYPGGLSTDSQILSAHLRSRLEVGRILRESGVLTIELQASIIIGSGSLSFELIRNLMERLPIMITPKWVRVEAQPIFIDDVLRYLVQSIDAPLTKSRIYEIGGADVTSCSGIMEEYGRQRGLNRLMIPVPFLTPWLSSLWLNLITPVYARIGRKLINSIRYPTVVKGDDALRDFNFRPIGIGESISRVLQKEEQYSNETRWSDSLSSAGAVRSWAGLKFGNRIVDHRSLTVQATLEQAFAPTQVIGGETGWYYGDWLWRLRGFIDYLFGGVGLRRGRRDPVMLRIGESVDFWRVEEYEPNKRLRLFAEMKLPGRAWLEFEVKPGDHGTEIHQTAIFDPLGSWGQLYWHILYPLHARIFSEMLSGIARQATVNRQTADASLTSWSTGAGPAS